MNIRIEKFHPKYRNDFYTLNAEWLNQYYFVTNEDELLLKFPEKIIVAGGMIFFAILNDDVVGTCAMVPEGKDSYELIKMGVLSNAQGNGIGSLLIKACIDFAKNKNANMITLETAVPLKAAIHLYEKFGFKKISDEYEHPVFNRVTFKMMLQLNEESRMNPDSYRDEK